MSHISSRGTPGGMTAVVKLTGNSGIAVADASGNINIITANSTPKFIGAVSTLTIDFGGINLMLGSSALSASGAEGAVGIGQSALNALNGGAHNTAVGSSSMALITSGENNAAFGFDSLKTAVTGSRNTALGVQALLLATGNSNVAVGFASMSQLTTGKFNIAIGTFDASNTGPLNQLTTGANNIAIGSAVDGVAATGAGRAYTTSESSNICIGPRAVGTVGESNVIRIGTSGSGAGQQNKCYIGGIDGVNVGSVAKVLTMASDQIGTATITAGTGITVTPGANTVTIAATATAFTWAVTTIDAGIVVNNGYIANKAGLLTMTLPASGAIGDIIEITGINTAVGWRIAQNANQQIFFGASSTTVGIAGYIEATAVRDSARLVCVVSGASTVWNIISSVGNLTVV